MHTNTPEALAAKQQEVRGWLVNQMCDAGDVARYWATDNEAALAHPDFAHDSVIHNIARANALRDALNVLENTGLLGDVMHLGEIVR